MIRLIYDLCTVDKVNCKRLNGNMEDKKGQSKPDRMNDSKPSTSRRNIWDGGRMMELETVPADEQDIAILGMDGVNVFDQRKLEQSMMDKMEETARQKEKQVGQKRANREIKQVLIDIREVKSSIAQVSRLVDIVKSQQNDKQVMKRLESVKCQKVNKEKQLKSLQAKLKRLQRVAGVLPDDEEEEISEITNEVPSSAEEWALTGRNEEDREKLIKLGLMTPFGSMTEENNYEQNNKSEKPKNRGLFLDDGFGDFLTSQSKNKKREEEKESRGISPKTQKNQFTIPKKKKGSRLKSWLNDTTENLESNSKAELSVPYNGTELESLSKETENVSDSCDKNYSPSAEEEAEMRMADDLDEEEMISETKVSAKRKMRTPRYDPDTGLPIFSYADEKISTSPTKRSRLKPGTCRIMDDGKLKNYQKRMELYKKKLNEEKLLGLDPEKDKDLGGGYMVPGRLWSKLYKYQKTGVRWLWELHSQQVGGILGDEMGLGKTIQIIAFLAGLQHSRVRSRGVPGHGYDGLGPVLIITPTTVMHQWVRELHTWWPPLRAAILHDSGTYEGSRAQLVDNIVQSNGVLLTSYERARINIDTLLEQGWHYVILDEGHKIRNPEAAVTTALKLFRTPHRIILSGSPVQNNLKELWSLFDFIFPGKLGILPVFMEQFSIPIVQGGYSNATEVQVHTAYKCACKLRDTISPYLLRRMKRDVQSSIELPAKNEQVLFCRLTNHQVEVYKKYLESDTVHSILTREMKVFAGLIQLRKICNHPDLCTGGPKLMVGQAEPSPKNEKSFGFYKRSGKMLVIASLLKIWKKQGHKVLLFSQSKAMIDIFETFVSCHGYSYLCMSGGTPVQSRQPLIKKFNEDDSIFVFLLTTRVGGLGVNLTGANRVVIYDPDWNPSTDAQAQERSWRIGQLRDVTIYRLLTSGTIEEKIYHRQIFKQFLTNRILKDPWQRRFFKSNDLHELFILKDHTDGENKQDKDSPGQECITETAAIFAGTGSVVRPDMTLVKKQKPAKMRKKKINSSPFEPVKSGNKSKFLESNNTSLPNQNSPQINDSLQQSTDDDFEQIGVNTNEDNILPQIMQKPNSSVEWSTLSTQDEEMNECNTSNSHIENLQDDTSMNTTTLSDSTLHPQNESINLEECNEFSKTSNPSITQNTKTMIHSPKKEISSTSSEKFDIPVKEVDPVVIGELNSSKEPDPNSNTESQDARDMTAEKPTLSSTLKESLLRAKLKFEQRKRDEVEVSRKVKKNKRRKRQSVIDGEVVDNLDNVVNYKGAKESTEQMQKKGRRATDDYVLEKLFKRAGVHSALQHNTIMDSAHPDFALVEVEAERVAKESVRNLRLSRRQYQYPVGQSRNSPVLRFGKSNENSQTKLIEKDDSEVLKVTKTKDQLFKAPHLRKTRKQQHQGESDEEQSTSREDTPSPLSASQLLSSMRRRNHAEINKQEELDAAEDQEDNDLFGFNLSQTSGGTNGLTQNPTEYDELMTELRNYIAFQCEVDGQAKTSEIMGEFRSKVEPSQAAIFKSILKELCHSTVEFGSIEKLWTLKPEFR